MSFFLPLGVFKVFGTDCREADSNIQIRKGIYYSLITTSEFEPEVDDVDLENSIKPNGSPGSTSTPRLVLPPTDIERCRSLMAGIVEHFTPVLFTPVRVPVT